RTNKVTRAKFILSVVATIVVFPAIVLLESGDWRWVEGWILALWFEAMVLSTMIYLYFYDPALLAERSKLPGSENQKQWDKYVVVAIYVLWLGWFIVMPLDAKRFRWSPVFPSWLKTVGGATLIPALYLIYRSTVENTYLSTLVRIQSERKQRVISTGVYSFVRHPLYLGFVLMTFGWPVLVGSIYGIVIGLIALAVLIGRIVGEERMLVTELEGYREYQTKVRYRLIPFIW